VEVLRAMSKITVIIESDRLEEDDLREQVQGWIDDVYALDVTDYKMHLVGRGTEPIGYACALCGRIEEASPDGSLPDDWIKKKFLQGAHFLCAECQDEKICRVCGCSEFLPCETGEGPCHWVEEDLCSACVETARPMKLGKGIAILAEPDPELIGEQLARESGLLIQ